MAHSVTSGMKFGLSKDQIESPSELAVQLVTAVLENVNWLSVESSSDPSSYWNEFPDVRRDAMRLASAIA